MDNNNNDFRTATLGKTGRRVLRIGIGSSYGASASDVEYSFERGMNYFMWALLRRPSFGKGLANICKKDRDKVIVTLASFWHPAMLAEVSVKRALKCLGIDYADVLLLGLWNKRPPDKVIDMAVSLKERGLFRHLALSTHKRSLIAELANEAASPFDIFHIRYNAAHRGAETEIFPKLPASGRPGIVAFTATGPRKLLKRPRDLPEADATPTSTDCYRFALTNRAVDVCIAGPKSREQLDLAFAALDKGPLSESEVAWMTRVGDLVHDKLPF